MDLGKAIKKIREEQGLKQIPFAKKAGITQTYLSQLENGKKTPSIEVLEKISATVNAPLPVLLWFSLEEKDIAEEKRESFRTLRPMIDELIKGIIEL